MSGGGSAPAQPSTTTQINDIPAWEQGYVTDLLGQAQTIAAQPYQQFPGQQIAGFTPDQTQAFSNIENMSGTYQPAQDAALNSSIYGANTANNIYGAGSGAINAATTYNPLQAVSPYLGAAAGYNSASAAQPWLTQAAGYQSDAANAATPGGIQSYMSPYTDSVVKGIQDQANLNWNQNIMPGINDKFVGSGQYGSGRNAQVLGQAAGNFQTGLSANVANALESGYNTAGTQAATQAGILGNLGNSALTGANTASSAQGTQVSNLLNQANAAGTSTQQQAGNLLNAGQQLGNLAATQGASQIAAGQNLQNIAGAQQANALTNAQALQGVGQQQQQLNQSNINTAMQNWQDQTNWPKQQTEYLNQIIRGLPAPTSSTSSSQVTPAYSVSPLAGLGGAGAAGLSLLGANGNPLGSAVAAKKGGLIKKYASGGVVSNDPNLDNDYDNHLDYYDYDIGGTSLDNSPSDEPVLMTEYSPSQSAINPLDTPDSQHTSESPNQQKNNSTNQGSSQQMQLLALAQGMLTPSLGGSPWASLGQGIGNMKDVALQQQQVEAQQQARNDRLKIEQQRADQLNNYHQGMIDLKKSALSPLNNQTTNLTGDEYLKTIPSLRAANAKAASEGRLAITPFLLKTPYGQQLLSDTMQYDPTYDAATAPARVAVRKDFTAGKSSKDITSLNTSIGHVESLAKSMEKLKNSDFDPYNYVKNKAKSFSSYPELRSFNENADAVSDELTRTFRGSSGAVSDIKSWRANLSPNMSPEEQKAAVDKIMELLDSRLDSLGDTYSRGMGKNVDATEFLSPKAKAAYEKIKGIAAESPKTDNSVNSQKDILSALLAEKARRRDAVK